MQLPLLDKSVRFTCGSCTACCDQPWRTLIEADKAHVLDTYDFSAYPQLQGKTLYRRTSDKRSNYYELAKGQGTRCVFLDSDGLCIIHKELGPEAKPKMCRQFPYLPARTWSDVRMSANYGCPSVQKQAGKKLDEQAEEIFAVVPHAKGTFRSESLVPLDATCKLTQEESEAVFTRAIALFESTPVQNIWTPFAEFLSLLTAVKSCQNPSGSDNEAAGNILERLSGNASWPEECESQEVAAFSNAAAAPMPVRMLFAATLYPDTIPAGRSGGGGLFKRLSRIPKLLTLTTLSGGYASRLLGRNVSITQVMQHEVDAQLETEATHLLLSYYRSRLWQRMIAGTKLPIIAGVHQHICDLNAILFMARAEALELNQARLGIDLIRQALLRVEFHLANQVRLYDHTLKAWLTSQLGDLGLAKQSLRLMALRQTVQPLEPCIDSLVS